MERVQDEHERAVGRDFITWYNAKQRTAFRVVGRPDEAPDLILRDGDRQMTAEVTTCYYDAQHARFLWAPARGRPDEMRTWSGQDFEKGLVQSINDELERKCGNDYGPGCVLLISVHPTVTTATMMTEILKDLVLPKRNPFEGIYLVGHFASRSRFSPAELEVRQLA